jgi:hypothetical protein
MIFTWPAWHTNNSNRLNLWLYDKREDLVTDEDLLPGANDGYNFAEWHASNVLQPLSPVIQAADGKEPGHQRSERHVAHGDVCYGMVSLLRSQISGH